MPSCVHHFEFGPCLEVTAEWLGMLCMLTKGSDT